MGPRTFVIVMADGNGRDLVRTVDSVARSGRADIAIAAGDQSMRSLADSLAERHGARWFHSPSSIADAVNEAARQATAPFVAIVPAGYLLPAALLDRCASVLDESAMDALVPSVLMEALDGSAGVIWQPRAFDVVSAVSDPGGAPPVVFLQRSVWESVGGLNPQLVCLPVFDLWLRLLLGGRRARVAPDPPVLRPLDAGSAVTTNEQRRREEIAAILLAHRGAIEPALTDVLIGQERAFAGLRAQHSRVVARRDADLANLDRLRAEAAHQRAFLVHHGLDALDWGDFRRTDPISRNWGYDRGVPVDRRHIESFLIRCSSDIAGAVLEVQEDDFTRRFGGSRVTSADVVDIDAANARATIIADLRHAPGVPADRFDCVILTQTLHVIDDMRAVVRECRRILKPGGVLLTTMPAASRVCLEYGADGDFWRMTPAGARQLVGSVFGEEHVSAIGYGNVLTNIAFLNGLGRSELTDAEFERADPYFPAVTGVRARKPAAVSVDASRGGSLGRSGDRVRGVVLLYHRIDDVADVHGLGVPSHLFDDHLEWLKRDCTVIALDDLLSLPIDDLPDRAVALTFDDGYLDNLREAAPKLDRDGLPSTFFLTTAGLHEASEYWWDALEFMLLGDAAVPALLDVVIAPLPTSTMDERRIAHDRLHALLVHSPLEERARALAALRAWSGGRPARVRPMLSDEVRELAAKPGVAIGAHTVNHLSLPDQPAAVRDREVQECRSALEGIIGRPVALFAYPYGAVDGAVADEVRRTCRWGLSCELRQVEESFDAARVPRLDVKPWSAEELSRRIDVLFRGDARASFAPVTLLP